MTVAVRTIGFDGEGVELHFQFIAELFGVEVVVMPLRPQQFGVAALLGDATLLDNQDAIRAADGVIILKF